MQNTANNRDWMAGRSYTASSYFENIVTFGILKGYNDEQHRIIDLPRTIKKYFSDCDYLTFSIAISHFRISNLRGLANSILRIYKTNTDVEHRIAASKVYDEYFKGGVFITIPSSTS